MNDIHMNIDRDQLIKRVEARRRLKEIADHYPLSVARLWIPHCHRWTGEGEQSDRPVGCGKPMIRAGGALWTCPDCQITEQRTSQADALINMGREATLLSGGNRAGKTEVGAMLAVATAAGSGEWWVREWLSGNSLPPDLIQEAPATVWASALSYADALEYIRPKIERFCPTGSKYVMWRAQNRASVILPNGGRIVSMSADAGRSKYQGASCQLVWLDEEHPEDIFSETLLRTVDSGTGRLLLTMTPLKGMTWVYDRFVENDSDGFERYSISGLDNPWISSVKLYRATRHMSEESKRSRLYGEFTNQSGLIYSEFSRSLHVTKAHDLPSEWPRFRAIDFGVKNPFCCLWFALDESDQVLHCYREHFATGKTTLENGALINMKSRGDPAVVFTVADPESKDGRMLLARHCNIPTKPAYKRVSEGIDQVKQWLCPDEEGKPHLIIHDNCRELLKEFRLYRWDKSAADRPVKKNDHGMDCLRYLVVFLNRFLAHR